MYPGFVSKPQRARVKCSCGVNPLRIKVRRELLLCGWWGREVLLGSAGAWGRRVVLLLGWWWRVVLALGWVAAVWRCWEVALAWYLLY